jgi:hypothetical protein
VAVIVHKSNQRSEPPLVSLILLDWSCRESLHALGWLERQDIPSEKYELIWVECYERVLPEAMTTCDVVITCGQKGRYHKHGGYNTGLIHSRGKVVVVCDSDAVFSHNFISSIVAAFELETATPPKSLVLMHYEYRTTSMYPSNLHDLQQLAEYEWLDLWANVGACMSVLRTDAIRFGGFDEHASLRGYLCGPYDLGWRMMNAGIPEHWLDPGVAALWHFAHPEPAADFTKFSFKRYLEIGHPHIEYHAATAVEALCTGRLQPLNESPAVKAERMASRHIDSALERRLALTTGQQGFTRWQMTKMYVGLLRHPMVCFVKAILWPVYYRLRIVAKKVLGHDRYELLRTQFVDIVNRRKAATSSIHER